MKEWITKISQLRTAFLVLSYKTLIKVKLQFIQEKGRQQLALQSTNLQTSQEDLNTTNSFPIWDKGNRRNSKIIFEQ